MNLDVTAVLMDGLLRRVGREDVNAQILSRHSCRSVCLILCTVDRRGLMKSVVAGLRNDTLAVALRPPTIGLENHCHIGHQALPQLGGLCTSP